ncbi:MAG: hypothetical protein HQL09_06165 [Nitrospirae bacterium]|nr:hypothetical protein [Nitrospirota bacterium]
MWKSCAGAINVIVFSGLLIMGLVLSAHAEQGQGRKLVFTKHFNESLFDITEKAEFSVEILLDEKEYKIGRDLIGIVIHNSRNQDVENASITVDYRNTDTGESVAPGAMVKEKGRGLYTVSNLDLNKAGRRKLTITVRKNGLDDSVQFLFPDVLKKKWPAGKYNP